MDSWKSATVQDLTRLSQNSLDNSTWQFLFQRDFGIETKSEKAQKKYFGFLLRKYADLTNRYARFLYCVADTLIVIPKPKNPYCTPARLKADAYENKILALSALGFNEIETDPYHDLFGNKVGSVFWKHLDATYDMLINEVDSSSTLVDALFDNIKMMESCLEHKETGYV